MAGDMAGDLVLADSDPDEIEIVHRMSKQCKRIRLISVLDGLVRVEWPMAGMYDLRRTKTGRWVSSPRRLLSGWALTVESIKRIDVRMAEVRAKKEAERQRQTAGQA